MKARLVRDPIGGGLHLCLPHTGNASALLLEWAAEYAHCPIKHVYIDSDYGIVIDFGDNHSFYSEAMNYINSNL